MAHKKYHPQTGNIYSKYSFSELEFSYVNMEKYSLNKEVDNVKRPYSVETFSKCPIAVFTGLLVPHFHHVGKLE